MIHLLAFIFLSIFFVSLPFISVPQKKDFGFLTKFQFPKKVKFFKLQSIVPSLIYLMNLFECIIKSNLRVRFIWITGYISWILGCCFWVLQANIVSIAFISASIIFCFLAIAVMLKTNLPKLSDLRRTKLGLSVYVLIISASVVAMVAAKSLGLGITTSIVLLLFLYDWKVYKNSIWK